MMSRRSSTTSAYKSQRKRPLSLPLQEIVSIQSGRVVLPEDFRDFLESLRDNPPEKIEVPLKWQLGETWQDGTSFLLLFAGLLVVEWFLRKRWGLV